MITFGTILSGVFVFVLGQTILKLFVEPWQIQRECIAKISNHLLMHANKYSNPGIGDKDELIQVSKETRQLAAELVASCNRIPFYETMTKTNLFPKIETIKEVQGNLIGLSNSIHRGEPNHNYEMSEKIKDLLNLN